MTNRSMSASDIAREEDGPEHRPVREELGVLDRLSQGLSTLISQLFRGQRRVFDRNSTNVDFSMHEKDRASLKAHEELAHHCYGKTVIGREVAEDGRLGRPFTYRITQANVGYADCAILARNSPLATALVTTQPGEEAEVSLPRGMVFLTAEEVRTLEGPVSLRSPTQKPNFRLMTLRRAGNRQPMVFQNLRSLIQKLAPAGSAATFPIPETDQPDLPKKPKAPGPSGQEPSADPTWLDNWQNIDLGDSAEFSLGHQFFTHTTRDQENALNKPFGLTSVEGIAGAGKTSVALGRLKFFANFSTGHHRLDHGIVNASENDFSPTAMMGFVLSHGLKRYLKETASQLGMERLPIRDFEEFRTDLSNHFGISKKFKRRKDEVSGCRSKISWLRAVDSAIARVLSSRLREIASKEREIAPSVRETVLRFASELSSARPGSAGQGYHLIGLARRIVLGVMEAEFRAREAAVRERWQRASFENRFELERALQRIQQEEERQTMSPLAKRLLAAMNANDLLPPAIELAEFPTLVQEAFGHPADAAVQKDIGSSVVTLRALLGDKLVGQYLVLTDSDILVLIAIAAMIADGFDLPDAALYQIRRNTAVFIDEVQDFTEIEIALMGMTALSTYNQVTLSGDPCQRLLAKGTEAYDDLFPFIPKHRQNKSIFLNHNHRQRKPLAVLSAGFRSILQGDARVSASSIGTHDTASLYAFSSKEQMAQLMLARITSAPPYATIAVIAPTMQDAKEWHDLLKDDLAAYHRPALLSQREDLTRRFDVHFTEARETKGLEFNIIMVPDFGAFALDTAIGRNQAYVAISRAKHALMLGCSRARVRRTEIGLLAQNNLLRLASIPPFVWH
jgi:hypothetical protein